MEDDVRGAEHLDLAQQEALLGRAMAPAKSVAAVPSPLPSGSVNSDELVEVRHCGVVEGVRGGRPGTSPVIPNLFRPNPPIPHPVEVRAIHGPGQKMRCLQTHSVVMEIRRPSFLTAATDQVLRPPWARIRPDVQADEQNAVIRSVGGSNISVAGEAVLAVEFSRVRIDAIRSSGTGRVEELAVLDEQPVTQLFKVRDLRRRLHGAQYSSESTPSSSAEHLLPP